MRESNGSGALSVPSVPFSRAGSQVIVPSAAIRIPVSSFPNNRYLKQGAVPFKNV